MEKPMYPGVDYSGHGIAGNNENTLPRDDWQQVVDLVKHCEKMAEDMESKVQSEEEGSKMLLEEIRPLSSQLKEGISQLRSKIGET